MNNFIKYHGKTKTNRDKKWRQVTCYVNFNITDEFKELTEREFQDHQGFDIEQIKSNPRDRGLLTEPHNIARAILLYKYFRNNGYYFADSHFDFIGRTDLPIIESTIKGNDFKVWVIQE